MALADLMGMHAVDIQQLAATVGAAGGVDRRYTTVRAGVPCRVVPMAARKREMYYQNGVAITHTVYFAENPNVDRRHRFLFGNRVLEYRGQVNPHEMDWYWKVFVEEEEPQYLT